MVHVLIIEATLSGHHASYLDKVAAAYVVAGCRVTIAVPRRFMANAMLAQLHAQGVSLVALDDDKIKGAAKSRLGLIGRELGMRRIFARCFRAVSQVHAVDLVFLPYVDYCLYALALLGSPFGDTKWAGICMRPSFHYLDMGIHAPKPRLAGIKKSLFMRLLGSTNLKRLITIDELLARFTQLRQRNVSAKLAYVGDPAELVIQPNPCAARERLGISKTAWVILCFGAIDSRKALDVLIAALSHPETPQNTCALVVGKQAEAARALLRLDSARYLMKAGRLFCVDDFVDDETQSMAFAACDAVWVAYRDHFTMSGVLVLADVAGKPVLTTQAGLVGWYAEQRNMGEVASSLDVDDIRSALGKLHGRVFPRDRIAVFPGHDWASMQTAILEATLS